MKKGSDYVRGRMVHGVLVRCRVCELGLTPRCGGLVQCLMESAGRRRPVGDVGIVRSGLT